MGTNVSINTTALGINWQLGETYRIAVDEGFGISTGNLQLPTTANSSIVSFSTWQNPPAVKVSDPIHTTTAPIGIQSISYTMDRNLLTVLGGNVYLYRQGSPNVLAKTYTVSNVNTTGNVVSFSVVGNLLANQTYFVTSDANIFLDRDGYKNNAITNSSVFRFVAPSAPSVSTTVPVSGNVAEKNFQSVELNFDRTITANVGNIYLYRSSNNQLIKTVGISSASFANNKVSFDITGSIEADQNYYVRSNANIVNDSTLISSNITGNILTFTGPSAPFISTTVPTNGSRINVNDANVTLRFDRTIAKNTGNIYLINANTNSVIKTYDVTSNSTVSGTDISVNVYGQLVRDGYYYIRANSQIVQDLTQIKSNVSPANLFLFQPPVAPTITSTVPTNNTVAPINIVSAGFTLDRNITKNVGSMYLYREGTGLVKTYPVTTDVSLVNNNEVYISVQDQLEADETYYITSDSNTFKDAIAIDYGVTSNSSVRFIAPAAPAVTSTDPVEYAVLADEFKFANVSYDRNLYANIGNVYLRKYSDNSIIDTYAIGTGATITNNTISANIAYRLQPSTEYYLQLENRIAKDISGIKTTPTSFRFTTPVGPYVTSTVPSNGSGSVIENQTIYFNTNRVINKNTGNIYLKKYSDNSIISTYPISNYSLGISNVAINISGKLSPSEQYYVDTDANVAYDNNAFSFAIGNNSVFSFTTASTFNRDWPLTISGNTIPKLLTGTVYSGNTHTLTLTTVVATDVSTISSLGGTLTWTEINPTNSSANTGYGGSSSISTVYGGGGGGAGGPGNVTYGGPGYFSTITGANVEYGRGADGRSLTGPGVNGGGGGVRVNYSDQPYRGGNGVVIVSYLSSIEGLTISGGDEVGTNGDKTYRKFTANSTLSISTTTPFVLEYLIVGGGGAGGVSGLGFLDGADSSDRRGGGGGGGGVIHNYVLVEPGSNLNNNLSVVVGQGGIGATGGADSTTANNGGPSSIQNIASVGGGGAGAKYKQSPAMSGTNGGSGGGRGNWGSLGGSGGTTYTPLNIGTATISGNLAQVNDIIDNITVTASTYPVKIQYSLINGASESSYRTQSYYG